MEDEQCSICKQFFGLSDLYEYRGVIFCEKCQSVACERRDAERAEIIFENKSKTDKFKGLDFGNNTIGKANREILKGDIEISKKESQRLKNYERPSNTI